LQRAVCIYCEVTITTSAIIEGTNLLSVIISLFGMYLIELDDLLMRVDEKSYKQSSFGKKGNIVLPLL
jgi:hypothetical protein